MQHTSTTDQFKILELVYLPMPQQNPVYMRPYTVNPDGTAINDIANTMVMNKSSVLTTGQVQSVLSSVIRPSTVGYGTMIDNSFIGQQRYIFMMKVLSVDFTGAERMYYIQGYTDHDGISDMYGADRATAAPYMRHTINSILETGVSTYTTPNGVVRREILNNTYNLLKGNGSLDVYMLRPMDVVSNIESAATLEAIQNYGDVFEGGIDMLESYNATTTLNGFDGSSHTSKGINNIASNYFVNVVNDGIRNIKQSALHYDNTSVEVELDPIVSNIELSLADNRFVRKLSNLEGFRQARAEFSFSTLEMIDPVGANNFIYNKGTRKTVQEMNNVTPDVGDNWNAQDPQTVVAQSILSQTISLCSMHCTGVVTITFDNTQLPVADPSSVAIIPPMHSMLSLAEQDMSYFLNNLRLKFYSQVFVPETKNGQLPLRGTIYIDLYGNSKIYLEFAGYAGNWYTVAPVLSSYMAPVVTPDAGARDETTFMFNNLISTIADNSKDYTTPIYQGASVDMTSYDPYVNQGQNPLF